MSPRGSLQLPEKVKDAISNGFKKLAIMFKTLQVTLFNFSKFSTTHLQISYLHLNFPLLSSSTHASSIFKKERQFQIFHEVESLKL